MMQSCASAAKFRAAGHSLGRHQVPCSNTAFRHLGSSIRQSAENPVRAPNGAEWSARSGKPLQQLRAWSRLAEELQAERVRLSNRVRHQLWRYYPQMQKLTNDLAAPWFLELWTIASTPAKAGRLRKSTVERLLKQYRIRRIDAETVLRILREPAIKVAKGVAEAASIHIRSLTHCEL